MSLFRFVRRAQPRLGGWGRTAKAIRTCEPRPDGRRQPWPQAGRAAAMQQATGAEYPTIIRSWFGESRPGCRRGRWRRLAPAAKN